MRLPALTAGVFGAFMTVVGSSPALTGVQPVQTQSISRGEFSINRLFVDDEQQTDIQQAEQAVLGAATQTEPVPAPAPERQPVVVTVVKGDSLSKIAQAHNTTYKRLFDANTGIADPNVINPGQQIRIPFEDEVIAERALPAPKPAPAPAPVAKKATPAPKKTITRTSNAPAVADGSVWDRLAACESGGRWNINTGNGYYGGLQFLPSTWRAVGGTGLPHEHSREEQIYRASILQARSGWGQWPQCARKIGLL